ncbi:Transmembrane protein 43 [Seminavis robusta]|uniref:Transmembrane protein 43 n=1 Tax=Seminavis robusta TaxID=568900 RepID=A0A9N8F0V3_9STRA|nr:Transmembrane protein 43 [Seminavis robusta]|eukprot:Sro2414_g326830.1 Transmembrane protein 43 (399) ;mRNA; r:12263-13697
MFWNDGRAVKRANDIDEVEGRYVSLKLSDIIEAGNSTITAEDTRFALSQYANKVVHITGNSSTNMVIQDPLFGINGKVKMYQWQEEEHSETDDKGNTDTYYTYKKVWSDEYYDSSYFQESGHDNPDFHEMSAQKKEHLEVSDSGQSFYYHYTVTTSRSTKTRPKVGDTTIGFKVIYPSKTSIIAFYDVSRLGVYTTEGDRPFIEVEHGSKDAATMLQNARDENTVDAWILRAIGITVLFCATCVILDQLSMAADIIPCIDNCLSESYRSHCMLLIVACMISVPLALFVISLGWLWYRPHIAWPLVAMGFVLFVGFCWWAKDKVNFNSSNHPVPTEIKPFGVTPENDTTEPDIELGKPTAVGAGQEEPDIPVVVGAQEPDIDLTNTPNNQNDPQVFKAP